MFDDLAESKDFEKRVKEGVAVQTVAMPAAQMAQNEPPKKKVLESAVTEEVQQAVNNWEKIVSKLGPLVRHTITEGRLTAAGDNRLSIVFTEATNYDAVNRADTVTDIENAISEVIGKSVKLDVKLLEQGQNFDDNFVEIRKKINIDMIEEEDY